MQNPTYTIAFVNALIDTANEYQISSEAILEYGDVTASELSVPDGLIQQTQLLLMFQAISQISGIADIALEVGKRVKPGLFSSLGYALKSCSNLGEAMLMTQEYQPALMGQGRVSLETHDNWVTLHWTPVTQFPELMKPLNEAITTTWLYFGRMVTGLKIYPSEVGFYHPEPADISKYRSTFNCPILFGTDSNFMTIPKALLTQPLVDSDPHLKAMMVVELKKREHLKKDAHFVSLTEKWLQPTTSIPNKKISDLAESLYMTERTLNRKLAKEGTSFRKIKEEIQKKQATYMLGNSNDSIQQIASQLGFSSASYFSQAFKRWFQMSPNLYREKQSREPSNKRKTTF